MYFHEKLIQYFLGIVITICFEFSGWVVLIEQFMVSLAFEFKEAVHQLVDCVYFDDEELLVEDLVVFGVDEPEALCEVRGGFKEIVVAEVADSGFSDCF